MVTQHGVPKTGRSNGSASTSTTSNNNTSTVNSRPANSRPGLSHSRAVSDSPSLLSSPPNTRRNSLPGDTSCLDDHDHEVEHLDSHITFLDSLDLDSTSTVDSEGPSPRVRRLCQTPGAKCSHSMPRRHTGSERRGLDFGLPKSVDDATSIMGKNQDREVTEQRREYQHQRRVGSAQSGRSIDSRPSTSNSIREEDEGDSEDERVRKKNGKSARQPSVSGGRPESSTSSRSDQQQQESRKGPIMGLTTSPGRRRHRSSMSTDTLNFDKKDLESEETGEQAGTTMSAWRRRRLAENAAAAFRKPVARSLSAGDYNKEEKEADRKAEKAALEEISKGKERLNGIGSETTASANGSPMRVASRRVVSSNNNGTSTIRSTSGINGVDKGKGSIIPLRETLMSEISIGGSKSKIREIEEKQHETTTNTTAAAAAAASTEAGRAAIAREEAARRMRSSTVTAGPSDKQQRTSPTLGTVKERPSSSASLRSGLPRPSNASPNTPIKTRNSLSLSSLASPNRAKSNLPSPSPRHERTKSAAPSMLQRSSSTASASSTSSTAPAATSSNSRHQSTSSTSSNSTGRDSTIRSRDPPKLRNFTAPVQPSPIPEASKEDISRIPDSPTPAEMAKNSSSSGPSSSNSQSRPSSSHSAIYSPTTATADKGLKQEEEEHQDHQIVDHLGTLRKITRASPPGSNRSSWSTEAEEAEDEPEPRERRRDERKKKEDEKKNAEREAAQVKELIASIDSVGKDQGIESPPRLSRTKSLDSVLPQRFNSSFAESEKQATPPRPRSAGRDFKDGLVTPIKLFSPDSEMGEFTARLLRSPAVEDYEDLLNMVDSDKEGEDSMIQQQQRAPISPPMSPVGPSSPLAEKHTTTIEDLINVPKPPREIIKATKPRRAIIKTAVIKKTVFPRSTTRIPKRSILEDDSDVDSLDHLIENDQDFSALLKPGSSDDEEDIDSIEILVGSKQYDPEETKGQPVRSRTDVATADRQAEAERAVHEKLMNRLKTLQLEVRSATRGIEVLEQWLQSPGDSSSASSEIISDISEQEGVLYRLRCEEERQRARLEWRILEEAKKKRAKGGWTMWVLKWVCVVLIAMACWMALEVAIFISQMPPEFSSVPYVLKDPPTIGTRPTRAIVSGVITATQLPVWLFQNTMWALQLLWAGLQVAWIYFSKAASVAAAEAVSTASSVSSSASSLVASIASNVASSAVSAVGGVAGKVWETVEGFSAAAPGVEVVEEVVQHPVEIVADAVALGSDQVIWGGEIVW